MRRPANIFRGLRSTRSADRYSCTSCSRTPPASPTISRRRWATRTISSHYRDAKTLFAPGTSWSYSNDGYATAGAILARLDGRSWADAVRARVLEPLGMNASSDVFTPEGMASAAIGYQFRDNDRPPSQQAAARCRRLHWTSSVPRVPCFRLPRTWRSTCVFT